MYKDNQPVTFCFSVDLYTGSIRWSIFSKFGNSLAKFPKNPQEKKIADTESSRFNNGFLFQ